jgi:hypothetical protein
MLKLIFRKGFPEQYMGQHKFYVFEIILNDGTTREAVVAGIGHDDEVAWADPKTMATIATSTVLGWRETYNCNSARQDIDAYFKDPISIVTKDHLNDAFKRHIERELCLSCSEYFLEKSKPAVSTAAG